jgi:restriction endonuclease S subunit
LARWFKYNCENGGFADAAGAKATIAHLTGVKLKALNVVVPPVELQNEFVSFAKQVDKSKVV